jgi:hypothetical protein
VIKIAPKARRFARNIGDRFFFWQSHIEPTRNPCLHIAKTFARAKLTLKGMLICLIAFKHQITANK